jgi:plasmid stability protein
MKTKTRRPKPHTTIYLPEDVKRAARVHAIKTGTSLSALVEKLLREHLSTGARVPKGVPKA